MIFWKRKSFLVVLMSGLALGFLMSPVYGASNFVRVPLGNGASIEVPKNWVVLSGNQRITIDTAVEAMGHKGTKLSFNFAANLFDDRGKTLALVHAWSSSGANLTQSQIRQLTPAYIKKIDVATREPLESSLNAMGIRMLYWYSYNVQVINRLYVLVHGLQHSGADDAGVTSFREIYVGSGSHSFTVTLSYQERNAATLLPIIDYMTKSLRQE